MLLSDSPHVHERCFGTRSARDRDDRPGGRHEPGCDRQSRPGVATVVDLKQPCEQDLEAALQIVPLIAVGAVRGAADIGAPFGVVESAVMKGAVEGTGKIGGNQARTARKVAEALIQEADQQDADLDLVVTGVVSGAAKTRRHHTTAVTEAAVEGLMDGAAQISLEAEQTAEQTLRHTDYLPQGPITRVLTGRTKTPR